MATRLTQRLRRKAKHPTSIRLPGILKRLVEQDADRYDDTEAAVLRNILYSHYRAEGRLPVKQATRPRYDRP